MLFVIGCLMNLFEENSTVNLLPYDGTVNYLGKILAQKQILLYYNALLNNIEWKNDEAIIFGKRIITARKVAWYASENFSYTYSNTTKHALLWTKELLELKQLVEQLSGSTFNSCLLNLYHSGLEGMTWHSDAEKELEKNGTIASVSLGAERNFLFKHKKTKQKVEVFLENGSLLLMKETTQTNWLHRLPTTKKINLPRINLTFRKIIVEPKNK